MEFFKTNDGISLAYRDVGSKQSPSLILIHGFTGSSEVFKRNIPVLSKSYRVIAYDLRGHGKSDKPKSGYHVSRLAVDLKNLIDHLGLDKDVKAIGTSLGCAVLWSYSELFTTTPFSHMVFVDQAPMQNYACDGSWGPTHGNRGCNSAASLAYLQATLKQNPEAAHKGTISGCLSYRSHPLPTDNISPETATADEKFFLDIAMQGDGEWYGKLMADHTALDWRDSIPDSFGTASGSKTKVLVVASERSGCFPSAGPLAVVDMVNRNGGEMARGVSIEWAGHWCYWEDPDKFHDLVLNFLR